MRAYIKEKFEAIIKEADNGLTALRKTEIYKKSTHQHLETYKLRRLVVMFYMKMNGACMDDISSKVRLKPSQIKKEIQSGKCLRESFFYFNQECMRKHKINEN